MVGQTPDHIALNVPTVGGTLPPPVVSLSENHGNSLDRATEEGGGKADFIATKQSSLMNTRRSLRRTWNQLPRLQRNLIILGVLATCITLMFLLPGEHLERKRVEDTPNSSAMDIEHNSLRRKQHLPLYMNSKHNNLDNMDNALEEIPTINENNQIDRKHQQSDMNSMDQNSFGYRRYAQKRNERKNSIGPMGPPDVTGRIRATNYDTISDNVLTIHFNDIISEEQKNSAPQFNHLSNLQLASATEGQQEIENKDDVNVIEMNNRVDESFMENTGGAASTPSNPHHTAAVIDNQWSQDRAVIEELIKDPYQLPITASDPWNELVLPGGKRALTIDQFMDGLDAKLLPQKQHFHGAHNYRQEAVVRAFKHSWNGYKKYAWGHDNLKPISESAHDWFGLGLTLVDSLDTMYIMGLEDEFLEAQKWVEESLHFNVNRDVNLFEVTIRVLGGLLSAYHLSGEKIFLQKSIELTNRLTPCFLSPSGIPYSDVNLSAMRAHAPKWSPDSSTSEVSTIQLEFRDLSRLTNTSLYERMSHRVNEKIHQLEKKNGLVPIFINANTGMFRNYATISLGARGDSFYEYLIKQWLQTGRKSNNFLLNDYIHAIDGVFSQLLRRTPNENLVYIGELINGKEFKPKMDHLTCYLPGTLLLGHYFGLPDSHIILARDLLETCYQTYRKQPTNLAPEITYFVSSENNKNKQNSNEDGDDLYVKPNDAHNLLRPEFIESLYYFYALTGNRTYQDLGWTIFQAFEKYTKVNNGYTSIGNVKSIHNTRLRDMMESFWLGETLKYFYLLFSSNPKEIDLEKWVFNTEAHLLPLRKH